MGPTHPFGRLRKRSEYLKTQNQGWFAAEAVLVLQLRKREHDELLIDRRKKSSGKIDCDAQGVTGLWSNSGAERPSRFGFTTTRKVGNATRRNRARRRMRVLAAWLFDQPSFAKLGLQTGYDMIFVGREKTPSVPFKTLQSVALTLADRAAKKANAAELTTSASEATPSRQPGTPGRNKQQKGIRRRMKPGSEPRSCIS